MSIKKNEASYIPIVNAEPAEAIYNSTVPPDGTFVSAYNLTNTGVLTLYQVPQDKKHYLTWLAVDINHSTAGTADVIVTDSSNTELYKLARLHLLGGGAYNDFKSLIPPFVLTDQEKIRLKIVTSNPWLIVSIAGYEYDI